MAGIVTTTGLAPCSNQAYLFIIFDTGLQHALPQTVPGAFAAADVGGGHCDTAAWRGFDVPVSYILK